jgi:hypothetical protein
LKKEALDTADRMQALIPGANRSILTSDVVAIVPLSQYLKRDEVKTKWCSPSIPLPTPQLMLRPILQLMLPPTLQATSPTTQLMLLVPNQTPSPTQDKIRELNLPQYKTTMLKEANINV